MTLTPRQRDAAHNAARAAFWQRKQAEEARTREIYGPETQL